MAFVEYQDVRYAAQAMATLQGSFLLSSDRGAIRIEYAKSKMAEVGFTNLWIEVGSTLCYDRPLQSTRGRLYVRYERRDVEARGPRELARGLWTDLVFVSSENSVRGFDDGFGKKE